MEIVRMAETVVDAAEDPVVVAVIADAAGAVEGLVVVDGIVADAADRAGEGTRKVFATDLRGLKLERPRCQSWPYLVAITPQLK
jgi:hypothetical protein